MELPDDKRARELADPRPLREQDRDNRDAIRKGMAQHAAREDARANAPKIGAHMATLNLFRETDGTYRITVAEARGFIDGPMKDVTAPRAAPIYYVEGAIIEAAEVMKRERS